MKPKKSDFFEERVMVKLSGQGLARECHGGQLPNGLDTYYTGDFVNRQQYEAIGLTYHIYDDGSRTLCWMLYNDENVLTTKAVQEFEKIG